MVVFEKQRIPTIEKDRAWRINMSNAICSRTDEFGTDWYRMWQNYRLKNNQIDQEEFREYCDTLGLAAGEGKKFVEPFNKTHNVIEVLKGEEASMPWGFDIVNISNKAINEMLREKDTELKKYIDYVISAEIERTQFEDQLFDQMQMGNLPPDQVQAQMQQLEEENKKKEEGMMTPEKILAKYTKYKSKKEVTMHKLLKAMVINQNLKWIKNQTFEDALTAGIEAVEIVVDEYTGIPTIKQLNVLGLYYHKSNDTPFIHLGDYAGYKEEITIAQALDEHSEDLSEDDIKKLQVKHGGIFGADQPFHSFEGRSVDHWDNMKQYEYTNNNPMSNVPSSGTTNVVYDGLYATDNSRSGVGGRCVRYVNYWKSQRRLGKLGYKNEYGEMSTTIVGEDFEVPSRAKKINFKPHMFSETKVRYEWEIDKENSYTLEWIWVPEIWKSIRINHDIHVKIEPYDNAYQSLYNPYKTKLPIYGYIYNNRNAFSVAPMDRMRPWQNLYYIVMAKWLKLISQDKGVLQLLNVLMMDKEIGYKESLQIAVDQGVLPYNPLAHTQGMGNVVGQMRAADRLDLSNSQQLTHYTNILQFIENQLKQSAGISEQRLAQTGNNTNVTDNQRDLAQSMNITGPLFSAHDILWQEILQGLVETAAKTLDSKTGFVRQVLSDDEIALIDLDLISMEDEYILRVGNNSRAYTVLEQAKGYSQALIQNDKAKFSTLIELLDSTNLSEFKAELKGIEKEIEDRENAMMMQQQSMQQEQSKSAMEAQKLAQDHELAKIKLKGEFDLRRAEIAGMAWNPDKDVDRDGVPDLLEVEKLRNETAAKQRKLDIDERKVDIENRKLAQKEGKSDSAEINAEIKTREIASKESLKAMELQSKERIANSKSKKD